MMETILWRVLRFNNMQIRFFIHEGNPFFDASDILAIAVAGSPLDAKERVKHLPDTWRMVLPGKNDEVVAVSPAGAMLAAISSSAPDFAFFEWLTYAHVLIAKGLGRLVKENDKDSASQIARLQLHRGELERELCAVGMTLGAIRKMIWELSRDGDAARVHIAEAMERKTEMRGAAFTAISALCGSVHED